MTSPRRPTLVLVAFAVLALTGAARAAEPEAVATAASASAGGGAPPTSTADQIDAYLKSSPALVLPKDAANGVVSGDAPRQVHGVVDLSVGTNGYRSAFVASEFPIGKTGTATIAVGQTRFDGRGFGGPMSRYGSNTSQSLAVGLALGGADPTDWRCRQAMEAAPDPRADGAPSTGCRTRLSPPGQ